MNCILIAHIAQRPQKSNAHDTTNGQTNKDR